MCGLSWSTLKTRHADWLKEKKVNIIVQAAFKKEREIADVPLIIDLTKDAEKLQILKVFLTAQEMARPFAAPPGIPEDRKGALVAAFDATMKDAEFLAETKKLSLDVEPVTGAQVEAVIREVYASPPAAVKLATEAMKEIKD